MTERLYLASDPLGRVDPYSTATSQGGALRMFISRRAGRKVASAVAWLVWLNYWRRGFRIVYAPAIPQKDLTHGR
jgi:hypothetical protein